MENRHLATLPDSQNHEEETKSTNIDPTTLTPNESAAVVNGKTLATNASNLRRQEKIITPKAATNILEGQQLTSSAIPPVK